MNRLCDKTNNIKVITDNSVVYLLGKNSGKQLEIEDAVKGINSIAGVKKVFNYIEYESIN